MANDISRQAFPKPALVFLALAGIAGSGFLAVYFGAPVFWDTLNYHFYNGHRLLQDGITSASFWHNIAPAQRQTFFNPLSDIPFAWLHLRLPGNWATGLMGAAHGTAFPLLVVLAWQCLAIVPMTMPGRLVWAVIFALTGFITPFNMQELGEPTGDNLVAILMVLGLVCLNRAKPAILTAGIALGFGGGLKLTGIPFVVGIGISAALIWLLDNRMAAVTRTLRLVAGGIVGFAASYGVWGYVLWRETGNPFFPQFNHLFRSPFASPTPFVDPYAKATTWLDLLGYPLTHNYLYNEPNVNLNEYGFRLAIALIVLPVLFVPFIARSSVREAWIGYARSMSGFPLILALGSLVVGYVFWLQLFSILRYAIFLEMLAPIGVGVLILRWRPRWASAVVALITIVGMAFAAIPWSNPGAYVAVRGQFQHHAREFAAIPPTGFDAAAANTVVMLGHGPDSFVVPSFPAQTRFVRINGNMFPESQGWGMATGVHEQEIDKDVMSAARQNIWATRLGKKACKAIRQPGRTLWLLRIEHDFTIGDPAALEYFGLHDIGECAPVANYHLPLTMCRAALNPVRLCTDE